MALRLAKTLGRSPESWLSLQQNYDLWQARRRVDLADVSPLKLATVCGATAMRYLVVVEQGPTSLSGLATVPVASS